MTAIFFILSPGSVGLDKTEPSDDKEKVHSKCLHVVLTGTLFCPCHNNNIRMVVFLIYLGDFFLFCLCQS